MTKRVTICTPLLFVVASLTAPAFADDPQRQLVTVLLQDERDAVPYSSIVTLDPAQELRCRMALASDLRADRIARQAAAGTDALVSAERESKPNYEQVQVTLIQPNLEKRRVRSDADGNLQLASLMPGVNVLVAAGAKTHGVRTLFVKMRDPDEPVPDERLPGDEAAETPVMTLISASEDEILPVVESYAPRKASDQLGDLDDIKKDVTPDDRDFDFRVRLSSDGTLSGRLISLVEASKRVSMLDTNVVLFFRGKPIARALTDDQGRFAFAGVKPGVYGIVVAGNAGYAAFSFEAVVEPGFVRRPNAEGHQFVSIMQEGAIEELPIVVVPSPMVPEVVETIEDAYDNLDDSDEGMIADMGVTPAPGFGPMGGFGGGPGGGSGGGGGIGGGSGDLAAFAAVGGLIAAAAASRNDDNAIGVPVEASPVIPTTFGAVGGAITTSTGGPPVPSEPGGQP